MTIHLGNVPASSTLYIPFATYDSNGASVTMSGLAVTDIEIYKNGSTTQRSSDNGYTLLDTDGIDFDGITGLHGFSVDLSDNTDAGFYAVGSFYWVVVSTITVSTQTVTLVAATFRIVSAEGVTGQPKVDVAAYGGSAGTFSGGRPEVNTTHIAGSAVSTSSAQIGVNVVNAGGTAWGSGAITAASIATDAITAAKIAADAIGASELAADAVTEIQSGLSTLTQANVRTAVGLGSANLDTQLAAIQADTDDIQTRLPAALTSDGNIKADALKVGGSDPASTADTASAVLTTQMTESYAADGTAPTLAQSAFLIQQQLGEMAISGTTMTVKKIDGSTTAATFTINSATTPTAITRAT